MQSEDNLLVYVHGVLENASDFIIVGVDEELQTLVEGEEFVEGGIFSGEGVRPHRSSGEKGGFTRQF